MASANLGSVKAFAFAVLAVMGIFAVLPASVYGQLALSTRLGPL
jgi:hypothetical protein